MSNILSSHIQICRTLWNGTKPVEIKMGRDLSLDEICHSRCTGRTNSDRGSRVQGVVNLPTEGSNLYEKQIRLSPWSGDARPPATLSWDEAKLEPANWVVLFWHSVQTW